MRLVILEHGKLDLRWTWLPYWLVAGPTLHHEILVYMRDLVVMNGLPLTEDSLDRIEHLVIRLIQERFKIEGLDAYLSMLSAVREP